MRFPRQAGIVIALLAWVLPIFAQPASAKQPPHAVEAIEWHSGLIEINENWLTHNGDSLSWAAPGFDDSSWQTVDIEDMGPAEPGWSWFRRHVSTGPDYPDVRLLVEGGNGTYELYVNGQKIPGTEIRSAFNVTRPAERVFKLSNDTGNFALAIRTHVPHSYSDYHLPLFLSITMGGPTAIAYERESLESDRLYSAIPTVAINLLVCLGGIWTLAFFAYQPTHRDYLFLGLYLFLLGLSNGTWIVQQAGVLPTSANLLFADPLTYFFNIAQIEFTFSFAGQRVGRWMRAYEIILLLPLLLVLPCFTGHFSPDTYVLIEAIVQAPVALLMPIFLLVWYRKGNREAGLLILPSLLPSAAGALYDLGTVSIYLGWQHLDFLDSVISLGPVQIHPTDLAGLLFLVAITVVMFFRFTRVSREQARAAAELDAAREIQRRLVPAHLPEVPNWRIEAAYLPAEEVGGDFYQVLQLPHGAAWVVVGDVSGKGLKAAMTGTLAIGALRALAPDATGPADLLARLNDRLAEATDGGFITCLCARTTSAGVVTLANAGHIPPYHNGAEVAVDGGLPLGIVANIGYTESTLTLDPGDVLTMLSDGVVEARDATGELFGFERTRDASRETAEAMAAAAQRFGQEDDITVLTVTRLVSA